ncbi:MAG: hypothetical protein KBC91_04985, partial [Candidatus Omnitrophica bacterium]|nr:hypothetical protein [Candidatus Omnitrophota bacterium]
LIVEESKDPEAAKKLVEAYLDVFATEGVALADARNLLMDQFAQIVVSRPDQQGDDIAKLMRLAPIRSGNHFGGYFETPDFDAEAARTKDQFATLLARSLQTEYAKAQEPERRESNGYWLKLAFSHEAISRTQPTLIKELIRDLDNLIKSQKEATAEQKTLKERADKWLEMIQPKKPARSEVRQSNLQPSRILASRSARAEVRQMISAKNYRREKIVLRTLLFLQNLPLWLLRFQRAVNRIFLSKLMGKVALIVGGVWIAWLGGVNGVGFNFVLKVTAFAALAGFMSWFADHHLGGMIRGEEADVQQTKAQLADLEKELLQALDLPEDFHPSVIHFETLIARIRPFFVGPDARSFESEVIDLKRQLQKFEKRLPEERVISKTNQKKLDQQVERILLLSLELVRRRAQQDESETGALIQSLVILEQVLSEINSESGESVFLSRRSEVRSDGVVPSPNLTNEKLVVDETVLIDDAYDFFRAVKHSAVWGWSGQAVFNFPLTVMEHWSLGWLAISFGTTLGLTEIRGVMAGDFWSIVRLASLPAAMWFLSFLHFREWHRAQFIYQKALRYDKEAPQVWQKNRLERARQFETETGWTIDWSNDPLALAVMDRNKKRVAMTVGWIMPDLSSAEGRSANSYFSYTLRLMQNAIEGAQQQEEQVAFLESEAVSPEVQRHQAAMDTLDEIREMRGLFEKTFAKHQFETNEGGAVDLRTLPEGALLRFTFEATTREYDYYMRKESSGQWSLWMDQYAYKKMIAAEDVATVRSLAQARLDFPGVFPEDSAELTEEHTRVLEDKAILRPGKSFQLPYFDSDPKAPPSFGVWPINSVDLILPDQSAKRYLPASARSELRGDKSLIRLEMLAKEVRSKDVPQVSNAVRRIAKTLLRGEALDLFLTETEPSVRRWAYKNSKQYLERTALILRSSQTLSDERLLTHLRQSAVATREQVLTVKLRRLVTNAVLQSLARGVLNKRMGVWRQRGQVYNVVDVEFYGSLVESSLTTRSDIDYQLVVWDRFDPEQHVSDFGEYFTLAFQDFLKDHHLNDDALRIRPLRFGLRTIDEAGDFSYDRMPRSEVRADLSREASDKKPRVLSWKERKKRHIQQVLNYTHQKKTQAARLLGISRATLYGAEQGLTELTAEPISEDQAVNLMDLKTDNFAAVLILNQGHKTKTAGSLNVSRKELNAAIKELGLTRESFDRGVQYDLLTKYRRQILLAFTKEEISKWFGPEAAARLGITNESPVVTKVREAQEKVKQRMVTMEGGSFFAHETAELKRAVREGVGLDELSPKAFALFAEAAKNVLQQEPTDAQIKAAFAIHQRRAIEMEPGEGKTLAIAMAAYLHALTEKGVHIHTFNAYLATRDANDMGAVLSLLGLSVGVRAAKNKTYIYDPIKNVHRKQQLYHLVAFRDQGERRPGERQELKPKAAYQSDVTYGVKEQFVFDYLEDQATDAVSKQRQRQNPPALVIVDEGDSVLLDESNQPLILAASAQDILTSEDYIRIYRSFLQLQSGEDYTVDLLKQDVCLAAGAVHKISAILRDTGFNQTLLKRLEESHELENLLKQAGLVRLFNLRDSDYVLLKQKVVLVDEFTGRLKDQHVLSNYRHQMIEAQEAVAGNPVVFTPPVLIRGLMTYQNYYRLMMQQSRLSVITGTMGNDAAEIHDIYGLKYVHINNQFPSKMKIPKPQVFQTKEQKDEVIIKTVEEENRAGRPVLIFVRRISDAQNLKTKLERVTGEHGSMITADTLTGLNTDVEAAVLHKAGEKGRVTIATNVVGRGVNIDTSPEVQTAGGLTVIMTRLQKAKRIDDQLILRTARRGSPGTVYRFYS